MKDNDSGNRWSLWMAPGTQPDSQLINEALTAAPPAIRAGAELLPRRKPDVRGRCRLCWEVKEIHQVVVDATAGDLHVGVADAASQVTVTEHRPLWGRATATASLDDGVLRLSSDCSSWFLRCSVDHRVELPAGADVQIRATAGEVRLVGVGDVDVELVAGNITVEDAAGGSFVTRTETGNTSIGTANEPELVDVTTTTGAVTITVPEAAYLVDAAAELGRVDVGVDQAADAVLTLRARTVTGSISIQPATAARVPPPAPAAPRTPPRPPSSARRRRSRCSSTTSWPTTWTASTSPVRASLL